jgi:hypothetical protein
MAHRLADDEGGPAPGNLTNMNGASAGPAGDQAVVREVVARLDSTLAASSARVELRFAGEDLGPGPEEFPPARDDHDPGLVERLVVSAAKLAWERVAAEKWRAFVRDLEAPLVFAGFAEPLARRYQVSDGKQATVYIGGQYYSGSPGVSLRVGHRHRSAPSYRNDPLAWLRLLRGVTEARYAGEETLRGTPCRMVILSKVVRELRPARGPALTEEEDNPAEFTVWFDEHHVRQIQTDVFSGDNRKAGTKILELWDFGVPVVSLDWTRFPGRPGQAQSP